MAGLLKDVKVLELAGVLAGPSVGQFLAEQGARVVKVEHPGTGGDTTRQWRVQGEPDAGNSSYFQVCNWGKQSVGIDCGTTKGSMLVSRLAANSDIVVSNFRPKSAQKLGLDFDSWQVRHPKLIIGEIVGYRDQPDRPGFDAVIQAESGFYYLNAPPGGCASKMPVALMDILAAHQLKQGILMALLSRDRIGNGSRIRVSLFDAAVSALANQVTANTVAGVHPAPLGSDHPHIVPYGSVFRTRDDRSVVFAVGTDEQFKRLARVLDVPGANRYATNVDRIRHRDDLKAVLDSRTRTRTLADILEDCLTEGIPAAPVALVEEALQQAGTAVRLNTSEGNDPAGLRQFVGEILNGAGPDTETGKKTGPEYVLSPPPALGAHTREVLHRDLGLTDPELDLLEREKVIQQYIPTPR